MLPSVPSLYRLCRELRVSPETLMGLGPPAGGRKGPRPQDAEETRLRRLLHLAHKLDEEDLDALLHVASALAR